MKIRVMELLGWCSLLAPLVAREPLDLAGDWRCLPDAADSGIRLEWGSGREWFPHPIRLPGTTDLAKLGEHRLESEPFAFHLAREWEFIGPVWFAREVEVPDPWMGLEVDLFLERVMWQSRVWVDGIEPGPARDSLCVPHVHNLGKLTAGRHTIIVRVDNRMIHPIGDKGHAYGDQTQSRWNGVVGKIELRAKPANRIDLLRVFPSLDGKVRVEVSGVAEDRAGLRLSGVMHDPASSGQTTAGATADLVFAGADGRFSATCEIQHPGKPRAWSEFDPHLCSVSVGLAVGDGPPLDVKTTNFGFREVARDGNRLLINRKPAFMRGNLECALFPKTGHPPTDVEDWRRIWKVYQDHGLNHARFHSWCPPEAALTAADEMGIYLQVEAPIWMDHWMASPNSRPEMDTAGHPQGLGRGDRGNDGFARAEIRRILDAYGNHPSFVFFCIGNELGTSDFEVTGGWMRDSKAYDPRHLYAASTARTITPFCDFNATHSVPGVGPVRQHMEFGTAWDYERNYGRTKVPIIAHEIGQWPVHMDWERDLPKYTGPLKPYRLMRMGGEAAASGVAADARELRAASGAVNRILYRDEIESFLRTPSCRGFQLLGIQDFTGQGEAMVGWLDPFYESKGTTDPAEFRRYCSPTVPLLKLPGYVFRKSDKPRIEALLHHFGAEDLTGEGLSWSLADVSGEVLDSGLLPGGDYAAGGVYPCGAFTPDFSSVAAPARCDLTIRIPGRNLANIYQTWVFPDAAAIAADASVVVTDDWEGEARAALNAGRKVVLIADRLGGRSASKLGQWQPLYWSVPFFPGQNRDTLGLMVDEKHPALAGFPTGGFGDWNWFRICQGARGFDLTDCAPRDIRPIARPVTDFHLNRRLGSIFEVKVGKGTLLVCGYNIREDRAGTLPETGQLRKSLIGYAGSKQFDPQVSIALEQLDRMFTDPAARDRKLPPRFANADLYVAAAARLDVEGRSVPWERTADDVMRRVEGVDYSVVADGMWRDEGGSAWHGKTLTVTVKSRAGVPGKLWVRFHDWNHNGRSGKLHFEGREQAIPAHTDGLWLEFPVIREDTNDGQLVLTTEALAGPNLMITEIAFVPEE
jgi:hypothetical protein